MNPEVIGCRHISTFSIGYLAFDPARRHGVLIDTVHDVGHKAGRSTTGFTYLKIPFEPALGV
jgi:hypothetical protein